MMEGHSPKLGGGMGISVERPLGKLRGIVGTVELQLNRGYQDNRMRVITFKGHCCVYGANIWYIAILMRL